MADPFVGKLTSSAVYSGTLSSGSYIYNSSADRRGEGERILRMHANEREEIKTVYPGGHRGGRSPEEDHHGGHPSAKRNTRSSWNPMVFPDPVFFRLHRAPKTREDEEKLSSAPAQALGGRPTFKVRFDKETGQTIIWGMGELHLEVLVERHVPGVQRGGECRPTRGCLSRNDQGILGGGRQVRQADRRSRSLRARDHELRVPSGGERGSIFENKSWVAACLGSTSLLSRRASRKPWTRECWPAIPWWTFRASLLDGSYHGRGLQRNGLQSCGIDGI